MKNRFLFLVLLVLASCNSQGLESENDFDTKKKLIEDKIQALGLKHSDVSIPGDVDTVAFLNADIDVIFQRLEIFASDKQKERDFLERIEEFEETVARDSTLSPEEKKKKLENFFPELIRGGGSEH
ncbi:hypothetical protein [Flavilitoribacter nigricans]|uniref:DUF4296 domain-containing protein n=1 Tax=Flavilitoribacter nigricans (strain ATCC 23147 / DSM 23189 / NBRC 102662 / NCIMB 1420 / SS-2) TaxID=1122177 RepID=A0A2D0N5C0_FLAN2|nr:hypothetical protein [Flavilitoribacter nigricans]PHN03695.1 hypothetical protein CRP01_25950 [Flavilitoribacter nigricans DSM 23189 = NBRC 102662]